MSTIGIWLDSLGLGQYATLFAENAIDIDVLPDLTETDLERLGVLLGDRKRLLRAISSFRQEARDSPDAGTVLPAPERRQLTVVFCDIVNSSALAAKLDPEDLSVIIRSFQTTCTEIIERSAGFIARFMGDGVLAYFGYPHAREDDAARAVRAALDLLARATQVRLPTGQPLQVRLGIATGLVVVEGVAAGGASEPAVVGETPNIAARMQSLADPDSIFISASTHRLLRGAFVCEHQGLREIKGAARPVPVWRVLAERPLESRFEGARTEDLTEFVGRQDELDMLVRLWQRAKSGEGQVVLLFGDAGIGKSRVIRALQDRILNERCYTVQLQCSPQHTNSPLHPVINQLAHTSGFERDDPPETKHSKLKAFLTTVGPDTLSKIELYASLLSIPTDRPHEEDNLTPRRKKELTIDALTNHALARARKQPFLLILEDAHWVDATTLELVDRLVQSIRNAPLILVITSRHDFRPPWSDQAHVTTLRLNRLSSEQCKALVMNMTRGKELPAEIYDQIVSKTDGIPLFIEELTKSLLESELLLDRGDRYATVGSLPALAIPSTLQDSLMARLDRLGACKEIAQIGAALGRSFSHELLAAVAPLTETSLHDALAQLTGAELIYRRGEPPEETYIFKHALVQDVAYESLLKSRRQQLHQRIGDVLKERFAEIIETQPELMAHHLAQASLGEQAIDYLRKAGERAVQRSANIEAIGHIKRALELLQALPESTERRRVELGLEVVLGQALIAGRGYAAQETKDILVRAKTLFDLLTDPTDKLAVLYGIWACHYVGGEVDLQQRAAAEFLAAAEGEGDTAALCISHRALGTTYVTMGEFDAGRRHLERARLLYDPARHSHVRYQYGQDIGAAALCYLSWAHWHLGHFEQATEVAREAVKHAELVQHPHTLAYTICHARGMMDVFRRNSKEACQYGAAVVSLCTEHGFPFWAAGGRILWGWAEADQGRAEKGLELLQTGLAAWKATGAQLWLPIFYALEAEVLSKLGRHDAALQLIDQAITVSQQTGERWAVAEVFRLKSALLRANGRDTFAESERLLLESLNTAGEQRARSWELRTSCDLADLWHEQGREQEALALLTQVYRQFPDRSGNADLERARSLMQKLTDNSEIGSAGMAGAHQQ